MTLVLSAKVEEAEVEARSAKEFVQKVRKVNTSSAQKFRINRSIDMRRNGSYGLVILLVDRPEGASLCVQHPMLGS
jgi:hypothetical protein